MIRIAVLLPLFALSGCAVSLEEAPLFGFSMSAVWFHWEESETDSILLTNVPGACQKMITYVEATKDFTDDLDDFDQKDYCEDAKETAVALARAADALYHAGAHHLSMTVYADGTTEPDEETYDVEGDDTILAGGMVYYQSSPYAAIARDWDIEDDAEDNCGIDSDDQHTKSDSWSLSSGEIEITSVDGGNALTAVLDASLRDEDDDKAGDIKANFTATFCELDG